MKKEMVTVKNNETIIEEKQEADWKGQIHLVQRVRTERGVEYRVDGITCVIYANW